MSDKPSKEALEAADACHQEIAVHKSVNPGWSAPEIREIIARELDAFAAKAVAAERERIFEAWKTAMEQGMSLKKFLDCVKP